MFSTGKYSANNSTFKTALALIAGVLLLSAIPSAALAQDPAAAGKQPVNYNLPLDEQLTYSVRAFRLNIATQRNTTRGIVERDGRKAVNIISRIKTNRWVPLYSIDNTMETFIDAETLKPLYYEETADEKDWKAIEKVAFSPDGMKYHALKGMKLDREETVEHEYEPENWPQDELSMVYYVRQMDLAVGNEMDVPACVDNGLETAKIKVGKKEKLKTIHGVKEVYYVTSTLGESKFYVGADERRIPYKFEVKLDFGTVSATLEEYKAGGG